MNSPRKALDFAALAVLIPASHALVGLDGLDISV
jgi:hypothetical protein